MMLCVLSEGFNESVYNCTEAFKPSSQYVDESASIFLQGGRVSCIGMLLPLALVIILHNIPRPGW